MITMLIIVLTGSIFLGMISVHLQPHKKPPSYETLFYNTPEENAKLATSSHPCLIWLLENVGLAFVVLLAYWLCL